MSKNDLIESEVIFLKSLHKDVLIEFDEADVIYQDVLKYIGNCISNRIEYLELHTTNVQNMHKGE